MQVLGAQLLCGEHPAVGQIVTRRFDLREGPGVGEQLEGVFESLQVAEAHDDGGRSTIAGQDNPLMFALHAPAFPAPEVVVSAES
jgi:hypothetical protein